MGKIYDSPSWGTVVGRIENDGKVYDGAGMFSKLIGRVDNDGRVYVTLKCSANVLVMLLIMARFIQKDFWAALALAELKATATFMTALDSHVAFVK